MRYISDRENTRKVKEDALKQYRLTRDKLEADHPGLLSSIKEQVLGGAQPEVLDMDDCSIDGKKNLETALKFLEISSGSSVIQAELKRLLRAKVN